MKGNEARSVLYLHTVPQTTGGTMEITNPTLWTHVSRRLHSLISSCLPKLKNWWCLVTLFGLLFMVIIGLSIWSFLYAGTGQGFAHGLVNNKENLIQLALKSPKQYATYKSTFNVTKSTTTTNTTTNNTTTTIKSIVKTTFFTSLIPLTLCVMLVILDIWLVGLVPATLRAWHILASRPLRNQQLLQTLPYYLAVSRSSCEVSYQLLFRSLIIVKVFIKDLPLLHTAVPLVGPGVKESVPVCEVTWKDHLKVQGRRKVSMKTKMHNKYFN